MQHLLLCMRHFKENRTLQIQTIIFYYCFCIAASTPFDTFSWCLRMQHARLTIHCTPLGLQYALNCMYRDMAEQQDQLDIGKYPPVWVPRQERPTRIVYPIMGRFPYLQCDQDEWNSCRSISQQFVKVIEADLNTKQHCVRVFVHLTSQLSQCRNIRMYSLNQLPLTLYRVPCAQLITASHCIMASYIILYDHLIV